MKPILPAIALLAVVAVPADAQESQRIVHVAYADLDLNTRAGVRTFDHRLAAAAEAVCPDPHGVYEVARVAAARACIAATMAQVKPQRDRIVASRTSGLQLAVRTP